MLQELFQTTDNISVLFNDILMLVFVVMSWLPCKQTVAFQVRGKKGRKISDKYSIKVFRGPLNP